MSFSVNLLTTKSEADSLLSSAQRDKRTLEVRKQSMTLRTDNSVEDSAGNAAELNALKLSLDASNAIITSLPAGDRKEDEITKKLDLELKIRRLTRNSNKLSPVSVLENEYDLAQLDQQLTAINGFITEVTARKAQLPQ